MIYDLFRDVFMVVLYVNNFEMKNVILIEVNVVKNWLIDVYLKLNVFIKLDEILSEVIDNNILYDVVMVYLGDVVYIL